MEECDAVKTGESRVAWGRRPIIRLLRTYSSRYVGWYAAGGLFLWLTNYLAVSIPGQIGHAIDALRAGTPLGRYVAGIGLMGAAVIVVRTLSRILIFNPGRNQEYLIRRDVFAKLMRLQPAFFAGQTRGDVVSRASNDVTWVRALVGFGGLQVLNVTMAVTLVGWKMVSLSPRLTLAALVPILIGVGVVQFGIRRVFVLSRRSQEQLGEISEHVLGTLQGMAAIQGFVAERAFVNRFEERNLAWLKTGIQLALIRAVALPLLVLSGGVAMFMLLAVGGPMAIEGTISVGELVAFAALLTVLLPTLRSMGWLLSVLARGRASLERIFELLDAPEPAAAGAPGVVVEAGRGPAISIRNLDFSYPDESGRQVLTDISVDLPAGLTVGLFGRTGSGKSTLLHVLARLYDPPRGAVFVDGVDVLDLDLTAWRRRLAVVPQRPFLFSDTISSNVALERDADERRIEQAVAAAALGPDIEGLQHGMDTIVGERGIMLSGGQRQRVALARGLYRRGDLLILDDVLSAVDHATEAGLVDGLTDLSGIDGGPTVLIASHRLSALRRTDLVLVLDRGRLIDSGRHDELVKRPGIYRETWLAQRSGTASAREIAS